MKSDVYFEAQQVADVLDSDNITSQSFVKKLDKNDVSRRQEMMDMIQHPKDVKPIHTDAKAKFNPVDYVKYDSEVEKTLKYDPYPDSIQQSVIQPLSERKKQVSKSVKTTSEKVVPAGIINLANNSYLTIATIAREANRLLEKQELKDGAVISLR